MNRDGILEMMDCFDRYFAELRGLVVQGDGEGLRTFFTRSKEQRDGIMVARKDAPPE